MSEKFPTNEPPSNNKKEEGLTRRAFLKGSVVGIAGLALGRKLQEELFNKQDTEAESKEGFELNRVTEYIHTRSVRESDFTLELHSLGEDNEYYPSFSNALFNKKETPTSQIISGGFKEDLKISTRFGTFTKTDEDRSVENFCTTYADRMAIDDASKKLVSHLSKDSCVAVALTQFFEDGGKIEHSRGHYSPHPLVIEFGQHEDPLKNESTLYHELLHYVFDKENSVLSESYDIGGADHYAIRPLEERLIIILSILHHEVPLSKHIANLYGHTLGGMTGNTIQELLQEKDITGLEEYISSDEFHKNYVHSGMITPLSCTESAKNFRVFRLKLNSGETLRVTENYKKTTEGIQRVDYGESDGVYIDVEVNTMKNIDPESVTAYVGAADRQRVLGFLEDHRRDANMDRGYSLTDAQIHDVAYLNAYNAVILENAFRLAISLSKKKGLALEAVFKEQDYQNTFHEFMRRFSVQEQEQGAFPVKKTARSIAKELSI
ncbi:MAG: hypothetical protein Q8Q18_01015 [bacterium]|nr:hypothetical protein [bacterium]